MTSKMQTQVEQVLEEMRPFLQADGGDVELAGIDEEAGVVRLRLLGACGNCPSSTTTMEHGLKLRLQEAIPQIKEVLAVS